MRILAFPFRISFFAVLGPLFISIFLIPLPARGASSPPKIINYQGRLLDAAGSLLGGAGTAFCFKFSLYDDVSVGAPDAKLWPSGVPSGMSITVTNGVFTVGIGDTSAGGDLLDYSFKDTDTVYLNTEVATKVGASCTNGDETYENLSPRQRILSSAFSLTAGAVMGLGQSAIGTTSPASNAQLTVEATSTSAVALWVRGIVGQISDIFKVTTSGGGSLVFTSSGSLGIGTSSPSKTFSVEGDALLNNLSANGALTIYGTATSTFAGGIRISSGCFELPNGQCAGSGGGAGTINAGTIQRLAYYSGATVLDAAGFLALDTLNGLFGIGTATPSLGFALSVHGPVLLGTTTVQGLTATGTIAVRGSGTSTFAGGVDAAYLRASSGLVAPDGAVGIGTVAPLARLHLAGGSLLQNAPAPVVAGGAALSLPGGGAQGVAVSGSYAYVIFNNAAGTDILRIIDIHDHANPAVVGGATLSLPGSPRSVAVSGRYAYIVFDNTAATDAFRIVDISRPADPRVVGGASLSLPLNGQHVFLSGKYAYLTFDNGAGTDTFRIIDISNPEAPAVVGGAALSLPTFPRQVYVRGRHAYVVFYNGVATDGFRIIDISDPSNPIVTGGTALSIGFSGWSVAVSGRYAFTGHDNTAGTGILRVVDIANPENPSVVGGTTLSLPGFAKSLVVSGKYLYVAHDNAAGTDGFRIIDVSSPTAPSVLAGAALSLPGFPKGISSDGRYLYLAFFQGAGTDIFRVIDPTGIESVAMNASGLRAGSLSVGTNAYVENQLHVGGGLTLDGGGLYVSGGAGITGDTIVGPSLDSASAFRIRNASSTETLLTVSTSGNSVTIGDAGLAGDPTTVFKVDKKADAGDPSGSDGAIYYNGSVSKFRCFENSAWRDCIGGTHITILGGLDASAAATNLASAATNCVSDPSLRVMVNFNGVTRTRFAGKIGGSLNAATTIRLQYHTGGDPSVATGDAGWTTLDTSAGSHTLNTWFYTSEAAIPSGAQINNVLVRACLFGGNGVSDPTITGLNINAY